MKKQKIYPWVVVALLWVVALLNYMDRQMLSTMQSAMQLDIVELQKGEAFGWLMGIFLWVYGLVSPFAGMAGDRFSRKWLVVGSLFVWSAVTFLMGYADTFGQLFTLRAVMGVSEALYLPSALSLIADWHKGGSRSLAVGIHMTGLYVGQAVGGFGATVAAAFTWHTAFHWFGIIGIAYALVLMLFLHDAPQDEAAPEPLARPDGQTAAKAGLWSGLGSVLRCGAFWVILLFFAVSSLPCWATSAIGLTLMVPSLLLLGYCHNVAGIVASGLLFGIGYGMFDANNMPILCQFVPSRHRSTAYGLMNMIGVFAGAAVTTGLGAWADKGSLGFGFVVMGLVVVVAVVLQLCCLRPRTDNME